MPPTRIPHEHRHTFLKIPRTNNGALGGAGIFGLLIAACGALLAVIESGKLVFPPGLEPYAPYVVFVLMIVLTVAAALGNPSYHMDVPNDAPHYGMLAHHDEPD